MQKHSKITSRSLGLRGEVGCDHGGFADVTPHSLDFKNFHEKQSMGLVLPNLHL